MGLADWCRGRRDETMELPDTAATGTGTPLGTTPGRGRQKRREVRRPGHEDATSARSTTPALQWITARVPPALVREIEAHAKASGTTRSDAIRECLAVGIEAIQGRQGVPGRLVDELFGKLNTILLMLDIIGPPSLGTPRLLAHWASSDRALKISEDELVAEMKTVAADEWDQAVAEGQDAIERPTAEPAAPPDEAS
jgi:ribbon-helix-helix CopG family protein